MQSLCKTATLMRFSGLSTLALVAVCFFSLTNTASAHAYTADAFVMEINTAKISPDNTLFVIPTAGDGYNYTVDCDNTGPLAPATGQTSDYICEYATPGVYTVVITGEFPQIQFGKSFDEPLLNYENAMQVLDIKQWGQQAWRSMEMAFVNTSYLRISAIDTPNLQNVTDMSYMFIQSSNLNADVSEWDVSNVENMNFMFGYVTTFNQDLSDWDISSLLSADYMLFMTGLSTKNYDNLLSSWSQQAVQPNVSLGATGLRYCESSIARATLTSAPHNWIIDGDAENCLQQEINNVDFYEDGDKHVMVITGTNLIFGDESMASLGVYGRHMVTVNGVSYPWCTEGSGLSEDDLNNFLTYGFRLSPAPPCYYLLTDFEGEPNFLISDTEFRIWVPAVFDINAPGTVSINDSPLFTFNENNVPTPTQTSQPLAPVATEVPVLTPLRTATLSVSESSEHQGCAAIDTVQTRLLAPDTINAPAQTALLGGVGFELTCNEPGGSALVSLRLGAEYENPSVLSAYKDLAGNGTLTPVDVTFVNRDGATYVEFPLTDGLTNTSTSLIDEDGVVDGRIVDPLYIAVANGTHAPTQPGAATPDSPGTIPGATPIVPALGTNSSSLLAPNSGLQRLETKAKEWLWPIALITSVIVGGGVLLTTVAVWRSRRPTHYTR